MVYTRRKAVERIQQVMGSYALAPMVSEWIRSIQTDPIECGCCPGHCAGPNCSGLTEQTLIIQLAHKAVADSALAPSGVQ